MVPSLNSDPEWANFIVKHIKESNVIEQLSDPEIKEIDTVMEVASITNYLRESYKGDYSKVTVNIDGSDIECTLLVSSEEGSRHPIAIVVNDAINSHLKDS